MLDRRQIAQEAVTRYNEDRRRFRKKLGLPPEVPPRHPLKYEWTFWNLKGDRNKDWIECLSEIITVDTIEGFCTVFNYLIPPSALVMGSDFYLFRKGIKPMWEDENNIQGGRWSFNVRKQQREDILDFSWLELAMAITSSVRFKQDVDEICGAAASVRFKGDKITLWTRDASNDSANYRIGRIMFQVLQLDEDNVLHYETHKNTATRTGSKVKPRLIFPSPGAENSNPVFVDNT